MLIGVVGLFSAAVGCSDSPTAPTPGGEPGSVRARPVDPRFDDGLWREIVFNGFDEPAGVRTSARSRVLHSASPNVYVWQGASFVEHIRKAVPRLAEQITGQRYTGRIESGPEDRETAGWITVEFVAPEAAPKELRGSCGWAHYGTDPGRIRIVQEPRCLGSYFPRIFAHELGHAFGLHHVSDPRAAMFVRDIQTSVFTPREQYHARLAYEVGRGAAYCGWPFSAGCAR